MTGRRRIRVWKILCWLVIGLGIAGWVRGCTTWDALQYRTGELIAPDAADQRGQAWWMFKTRTYSVALTGGSIVLGLSEYDSLGPEPGELSRQWSDHVGFARHSGPVPTGPAFRWLDWSWPDRVVVLGVGVEVRSRSGNRIRAVRAPIALLIALAATPLLISWRRQRRLRRRLSLGLCSRCGYNRAGLASGQPCPECGRQGAITTATTSP